jgi:hypothetical protein
VTDNRAMNDLDYLKRSFGRMCEEAVQSAQQERTSVISQAAAGGALYNSRVLLVVASAYERAAATAADKMVRLAFELTGSTSNAVCAAVEEGLRLLRDALSNDLIQFFKGQGSWMPDVSDRLSTDFLQSMDKRIAAAVDDLSHGIAGGVRLNKDPLVSVISKITNSPGAVLQGGIGNVQHATTGIASSDIRSALAQFISSKEVQSLSMDDKQSIADVADVVANELDRGKPDRGKIARWGKRLIDVAEKLGVGVAASALSHALFG